MLGVLFNSYTCDCDDGFVVAGPSDYTSEPDTLEFAACSRRSCASIAIENDNQLEGNEFFYIQMFSLNSTVTIDTSRTKIEINDDRDGTYYSMISFKIRKLSTLYYNYVDIKVDKIVCLYTYRKH